MSKNIISASIVAAALALWLGSGMLFNNSPSSQGADSASQQQVALEAGGRALSKVRVAVIRSELRDRHVVLRGRTESKRSVDVKAEIAATLVSRPAERGMRVSKGDLLCQLAIDDRAVALQEARAAFETSRIEQQGSLELKKQGLLSAVAIANSEARLEAAKAHLRRQELNLARTRIVAPFDGIVEALHMNEGDYAVAGAPCVTLIDLDPMLIVARVTEAEVESLLQDQAVSGLTITGRELAGSVSFVGTQSDPATRTYPVEITVDNQDYSIRSGLTVELRIGVETVSAHQISPSLLTLNDAGQKGIRILDASNRVVFKPVEILEDGAEGMWISGLPSTANLITVGHEFVAVGDIVEPVFSSEGKDRLAGL